MTLSLLTLKFSKSALKYVPAAPEFPGQPILKPPVTTKAYNVYKFLAKRKKFYKKLCRHVTWLEHIKMMMSSIFTIKFTVSRPPEVPEFLVEKLKHCITVSVQ